MFTSFNWKTVQDRVEDVFGNDVWNQLNEAIPRRGPAIDGYQTADEIIMVVETPGLSSVEKINVKLRGYRLIVHGEIPEYASTEGIVYVRKERFSGEFIREVELPHNIIPDGKIRASYKNGLLEIHIPRLMEEDDKEIKVDFKEE